MQNKLNRSVLAALVATLLIAPVGAQPMSDEAAVQLLQRVNELEQELRNLRGDNETLQNELETIRKSQQDTFQQVDERIEKLQSETPDTTNSGTSADKVLDNTDAAALKAKESATDATDKVTKTDPNGFYSYGTGKSDDKNPPANNAAAPPAEAKTDASTDVKADTANSSEIKTPDKAALPEQEERSVYDHAFQTLLQDPKEAVPEFRAFLKDYPKSPLAASAQYWVGEALYAEKDFKAAIEEFLVVLKEHKGSDKAPDAALKLGYSFYELKDWEKARKTLEDVISFFPDNAETSKLAKARLDQMQTEGH
ncbi:tol-pal system protein YbgF [Thiothrix caldifontis]|uniref:Cell division coordinator CpoB n=1 Tax=Thiothrix caldifontis TaxID=525918 RepID=A0A1H3Z6W7_9GAMM|nr:tol-pal system protein YbgF [Thiothrix caldifontis]SEA19387.1 tol-pal system protein YbgF [Thiothrix caldifontis]